MNYKYILTIDQSTTTTKVFLFGRGGEMVDKVSVPHKQYYPSAGFVEHDPREIFENTLEGMEVIMSKNNVTPTDLASIGVTNQRETVLMWDRISGEPFGNAAVWQCQRGVEFCNTLKGKGFSEMVADKTGLIIDPYFSASKLHWMMENMPGLSEKARMGEVLLGTMDSWLLWKLTGGKVHATDYSNACRTLLFNIKTLEWDEELIELFGLYKNMFPEVRYSDEIFGFTDPSVIFNIPVPISGILGDSHAALFGQNCFTPGMGKATYGTGSSVMMNIGEEPKKPPEGLVTSIGYGMSGRIYYVYEGNIHCTGDTINWLKNDLELIKDSAETEDLALSVEDNNGVYFVPAFVGLGAPYWDNEARACLSGMARNTKKAHVVRAALESIAYQIKDLIFSMENGGNIELEELRVDGGATQNNFLMQFQADIIGRSVVCAEIDDVSALGSTFMAGLATGFWKDLGEIKSLKKNFRKFCPKMRKDEIDKLYKGWKKAIERTRL